MKVLLELNFNKVNYIIVNPFILILLIGKAKFLHGPVGQGSRMKLVVNMVMGTMMGAFVEGMKLAESIDISQEQLLAVSPDYYSYQ
jgi:3-hydroxyisobutyrate dehydrogenase-like beta-hydroxyacid dehydrogenase